MKKTQWTELFQSIRQTRVSYVALILFITLSISFFFGIGWAGKSMELSLDAYLSESHSFDVEFICPLGISQDTIDELSESDDVLEAEGTHLTYGWFSRNDVRIHATLRQVTDKLNQLEIIEGTLPQADNEIAVDYLWASRNEVTLGETIEFEQEAIGVMNTSALKDTSFTIVGIVISPPYACSAISYQPSLADGQEIDVQMYLPKSAFSTLGGDYSGILLRSEKATQFCCASDEYKQAVVSFRDEMSEKLVDDLGYSAPTIAQTQYSLIHVVSLLIVSDICSKLRWSLALLFLIISFLVCYSTITRKVYFDSRFIGLQKALGFKKRELLARYLSYTGIAVLIGLIFGVALGFVVERTVAAEALKTYYIESLVWYFDINEAILLILAVGAILLLITLLCVQKTVQKHPVALLSAQTTNKQTNAHTSKKAWINRLSLLNQTIVSNFVNDKRRVISTIIGVAGCAALIVTACTFFYNTYTSHRSAFDEVFNSETFLIYDATSTSAHDEIKALLSEHNIEGEDVFFEGAFIEGPDKDYCKLYMIVPMSGNAFPDDVSPTQAYDDDPENTASGIWIGNAYRNYYGKDALDEIDVITGNGETISVSANGSYVSTAVCYALFADKDSFAEQYGIEPVANAIVIDSDNSNTDELLSELRKIDGFTKSFNFDAYCWETSKIFVTIAIVIATVYLIMSVIMGLLVLLNILNQFVEEKRIEIIVLRINGFDRKYARRYIYSDTIFLTIIGIIIGCVVGTLIGNLAVSSFDCNSLCLAKNAVPLAIGIGVIATSLTSFIMCQIAMRRIDTFHLSDLNR